MDTLAALCDILEVVPNDLIEITAAPKQACKTGTSAGSGPEAGKPSPRRTTPPATWAVVTAATGSFAAEGTTAKPSDGVVLRAKIAEDNLDQLGRPAGVGSRRRDPHVLGTVGRA